MLLEFAVASVLAGDVVLLMGDSQAFLLKRHLQQHIQASDALLLSEIAPGSSIVSWAIGNDDRWLRIRRAAPEVLLVSLGSNDVCAGRYFHEQMGRFLRRLARVRFRDVYWIGPPAITRGRAPDNLRLLLRRLQEEPLILFDSTQVHIPLWPDGLHPSEEGQRVWADWIWENLNG